MATPEQRFARMTLAEFKALPELKPSKYRNRKVKRDGETWDSVREYKRHLVLLDMQKNGEIRNLKRQVTFQLVVNGALIGSVRPDWTYERDRGPYQGPAFRIGPRWGKVAEDAKGFQTPDHKTRWNLAQALFPTIDWKLS